MRQTLSSPPRLPLIAPSILSADFARMGEECAGVLGAGADLLHLDVMDGHFVPNLTMGPDMCRALRRAFPEVCLDVHLMVSDPARFVDPFLEAGADHLTFHVEAVEPDAVGPLADRIRAGGATAGLAINPPTDVERILPLLDRVEMALVMSVNPGFSGQRFIGEVLDKTRRCRERMRPEQRLQMDGGIAPANAGEVIAAGCDVLVAASAIFAEPAAQRPAIIGALRAGRPA